MTQVAANPVIPEISLKPKTKTVSISNYEDILFILDPSNGIILLEKVVKKDELSLKVHGYIDPVQLDPAWQMCINAKHTEKKALNIVKMGFSHENLKYYESQALTNGDANHLIVLEYTPRMVPIRFKSMVDGKTVLTDYNLPMPYIQFYCIIKEIKDHRLVPNVDSYITCTKTPVKTNNDFVYKLPMTNIHTNGHICWGKDDVSVTDDNIIRLASKMLTSFFSLNFNNDLNTMSFTYSDWNNQSFEWINNQTLSPINKFQDIINSLRKNYA